MFMQNINKTHQTQIYFKKNITLYSNRLRSHSIIIRYSYKTFTTQQFSKLFTLYFNPYPANVENMASS